MTRNNCWLIFFQLANALRGEMFCISHKKKYNETFFLFPWVVQTHGFYCFRQQCVSYLVAKKVHSFFPKWQRPRAPSPVCKNLFPEFGVEELEWPTVWPQPQPHPTHFRWIKPWQLTWPHHHPTFYIVFSSSVSLLLGVISLSSLELIITFTCWFVAELIVRFCDANSELQYWAAII